MLNFPTDLTDFHRFLTPRGVFAVSLSESTCCLQQDYLCKSVRSVGD